MLKPLACGELAQLPSPRLTALDAIRCGIKHGTGSPQLGSGGLRTSTSSRSAGWHSSSNGLESVSRKSCHIAPASSMPGLAAPPTPQNFLNSRPERSITGRPDSGLNFNSRSPSSGHQKKQQTTTQVVPMPVMSFTVSVAGIMR